MTTLPDRLGPFLVVRELGAGGMGRVLEVQREGDPRRLALKLLHLERGHERERLRREGVLLARLRHPGIVAVHEQGELPGAIPYLLTDLAPGRTLAEVIHTTGRLSPGLVRTLGSQLAGALAYAHEQGIVHRDVKPANVMVYGERALLMDFGLARAADLDALTRSGQIVGTLHYLAPEQLAGSKVGPPADVYALGALLFEALVGDPPLDGGSGLELLGRIAKQVPPSASSILPEIDRQLSDLVAACLEKDPAARPTAAALALALADPSVQLARSRRWLWAALLAVAGLVGVVAWSQTRAAPVVPAVAPVATRAPTVEPAPLPVAWALERGQVLRLVLTGDGGTSGVSFRWVLRLRVERVQERRVELAGTVVECSNPEWDGVAAELSLDPRTGAVHRVTGFDAGWADPSRSGKVSSPLVKHFINDETFRRLLDMLLHVAGARPGEQEWTSAQNVSFSRARPDAVRRCRVVDRTPAGAVRVVFAFESLPEDLRAQYGVTGEAEWKDGGVVRASAEETDRDSVVQVMRYGLEVGRE